jgi:hypothetical protein
MPSGVPIAEQLEALAVHLSEETQQAYPPTRCLT